MELSYQFNSFLSNLIKDDSILAESMNYSLLAQSKRIRPLLLLTLLQDLQGNCDNGFYIASGIEMIHTYSLIHDDLPAMDNDDYRRGKLTNHKKYNEATAILAGDALLTESFRMITLENCSDNQKVKITNLFSLQAGYKGMCLGQQMDIETVKSIDLLTKMETLKTGCLLSLPLQCACILANREELLDTFNKIGNKIGLSFQIQDDILDITSNSLELGKSTSDINNNKVTFVSLLGIEKSKQLYVQYYDEVIQKLTELKCFKTIEIIENLKNRKK